MARTKKTTIFSKGEQLSKKASTNIQARYKGSIPPDLHKKLLNRVRKGTLRLLDGKVEKAVYHNGKIHLKDKDRNVIEQAGTVLLATGLSLHFQEKNGYPQL